MTLPKKAVAGTRLTANYLNELRAEVRRHHVTTGNGISSLRTDSGTAISLVGKNTFGQMPGRLVTVLNTTGSTLDAFSVAGIEQTDISGDLIKAISRGVGYVLREPESDDLISGWVILAEQIKDGEVGRAYISGDGILTRVKYNPDGSEDDLKFAEIDIDKTGEDLFFLYPSLSGSARILDAETEDVNPTKGWRWVIVRFPVEHEIMNYIFKATADEADGEITAKRVDSLGVVQGVEFTFKVLPE